MILYYIILYYIIGLHVAGLRRLPHARPHPVPRRARGARPLRSANLGLLRERLHLQRPII